MRKGWEYKKLGEVCVYPSKRILVSELNPKDYVGVENLQKDRAGVVFSDKMPNTNSAIAFSPNDILIGNIRPYLKKIWLADKSGGASGDVVIIRISTNDLLPMFLYKVLASDHFFEYDNTFTKGAKMPRGDRNAIAEFMIPLPPKSTQLAIVSELDKINDLIRLKKEQLKDFDNLAQSLFYEMFGDPVENEKGWEVKKIKDIAKYYNGVAHEQDVDKDGDFVLINAKFISSEGQIKKYSSIQRFPLLKNDIVMVLSDLPNGKSLAKCFLIDEDNKYTLNQRICCFRGFEGSSVYLKNIINRNPYLLSFDNGKGQTNLRKGDVEKLPIPLPPLSLQRLFAQRIEQIEREKSEVQKSIQDLETLLVSRMQYWFE